MSLLFGKVSEDAANDFFRVIKASDVRQTSSNDKNFKVIQQYKDKSNHILIFGMLPRIIVDNLCYSKAFDSFKSLQGYTKFVDM